MYHVANGIALTEYLVTLYFLPSSKSYPYISLIGRDRFTDICAVANIVHRHNLSDNWSTAAINCDDTRDYKFFACCRVPQT